MKKRYFKALLLLLLAMMLPSKMWADQPYVKLAVADNAESISASNSLSLTFCYGTKGTDSDTEKYFDLNVGNNTPGWLGTYSGGVFAYASQVKTATFDPSFAAARPTSTIYWFYSCSNLTAINGISNLNTDNVTDMSYMFFNCSSLTSLDLSNWDTSSVTTMAFMFYGCSSLTSLDVSSFNTDKVTDMSYMFSNCSKLTSLDLSNFNTAKVTTMQSMFNGCSSLTSLNLSNFNTASVKDMSLMFYKCSSLTSLNLSSFNTASVTTMRSMFNGCSALTSLNLSSFNTAEVTNMNNMFKNNVNLEHIYMDILYPWDTNKVESSDYMFTGCNNLPSFNPSNVTKDYIDTYITKAFTYSDNVDMSNNLASLKTTLGVSDLKDGTIPAVILDRTMPTTNYGTICLPVALSTKEEVENVFGTGTVVKKLKNATFDSSSNILSFTFEEKDNIEAGVPYLIKSTNAKPEPIANATITATANGSITIEDVCTMYGLLKSQAMTEDRSILFMSGGELYYPNGGTLKAMRCYFQLLGAAADAANNGSGASSARPRAVINFDNAPSETGILSINADGSLTYEETGDWYTLGGVKLSGKPVTKGMYILNGKKYIVK